MASHEGRIPEIAFKVVSGVAFAIAMTAALARTLVHLRTRKPPQLDDYLLLLACICLTASTVLLYYGASSIYTAEALSLYAAVPPNTPSAGSTATGVEPAKMVELLKQVVLFERINWAYLALSWAAIFWVKLAYLSFFRPLVSRLPRLHLYWKVLVAFTFLVFIFLVLDAVVTCPKLGAEALACGHGDALTRALILGGLANVLDIIVDIMILFIPISLLWRVQMKLRQKLGLGAFLCLSFFIVAVAIVRVAGFHYHGMYDDTWVILWSQLEACVAVTMVSLTAFRSFFVATASEKKRASPRQASSSRLYKKHAQSLPKERDLADLTIPSATLTGMRTMISRPLPRTLEYDEEAFLPAYKPKAGQLHYEYYQNHPSPF